MGFSDAIAEEARRFAENDNQYLRDVYWGALPVFRRMIAKELNVVAASARHLAGREHPVALTLACGDMSGEYTALKGLGVAEIDAFDISEGQRDKFYSNVYDGQIPVNYAIADVNEISLDIGRYDVVYVQMAYHHIEQLEHVADEIRASLRPGGVFALVDYIGANYLQRTPRQRELCGAIWQRMPERYRIARNGKVVKELRIPPKETLPPYEAIRSEDIMSVLDARFEAEEIFLYGGILLPLFNGFTPNFTDSFEDESFLHVMWQYDRWLIGTGNIEPNYVKAIFRPRASVDVSVATRNVESSGKRQHIAALAPPDSGEHHASPVQPQSADRRESATAPHPSARRGPHMRLARVLKRRVGYRLGHLFARVTHKDRRDGQTRHSVVAVLHYDWTAREVVVLSAHAKTGWFRDIRKAPTVEIAIGHQRFRATARLLNPGDTERLLARYERRHRLIAPLARRWLSSGVGWRYDGTEQSRRRLANEVRVVGFREQLS